VDRPLHVIVSSKEFFDRNGGLSCTVGLLGLLVICLIIGWIIGKSWLTHVLPRIGKSLPQYGKAADPTEQFLASAVSLHDLEESPQEDCLLSLEKCCLNYVLR